MQTTMLTLWVLLAVMVGMARGHGMVIDPPQRSSMWRFNYKSSPKNYDDNALYCGGFARQWRMNGGKCGICGDPYDVHPRPNEAGGPFATGVIVETYQPGQVIDVSVDITANHMGYFVFKLCPNNDVKKEATQGCLDQHVLKFVGHNGEDLGTKFYIDAKVDVKHVRLQLPPGLTCSQCVMQWTYNTGNSWGCGSEGCCIGCGPQENFVNCIDVAITSASGITDKPKVTYPPNTARPPTAQPTRRPQQTTPFVPARTTRTAGGSGKRCRAAGIFAGRNGMDEWCVTNCRVQFCPPAYCTCS